MTQFYKALRLGVAALLIIFSLVEQTAHARNMHGRLGVGYNNEFTDIPAISLKYGLTHDIAGALIFGIITESQLKSATALRFFKNIFFENNLNFFFFLGGGVVTQAGNSGAEFQSGLGTEFFIPGLESLGFSVDIGAKFGNISGSFILSTLGASFLNAGIHFYF